MRTVFPKVEAKVSKSFNCPACGKKVRRQTTLWQTVSPFNKNSLGQPKTWHEIRCELDTRAAEWKRDIVKTMCTECQKGGKL